jgi:hypothetical protein
MKGLRFGVSPFSFGVPGSVQHGARLGSRVKHRRTAFEFHCCLFRLRERAANLARFFVARSFLLGSTLLPATEN